eukprot:12338589-Prorocentrum_lima.AAC.1
MHLGTIGNSDNDDGGKDTALISPSAMLPRALRQSRATVSPPSRGAASTSPTTPPFRWTGRRTAA